MSFTPESILARMWQDAQLGFKAGARENGRPRSSPRPGDIKIHPQQQKEKLEHFQLLVTLYIVTHLQIEILTYNQQSITISEQLSKNGYCC